MVTSGPAIVESRGDTRLDSQADTTLRLVSPITSSPHGFNLQGTKRKWEDINEGRAPRLPSPLSLVLQCSTSTSESSKRSSGTPFCTSSSSSPHLPDEESSSMDLDLNFQLNLNGEAPYLPKLPSLATPSYPAAYANSAINLQLTLSVGASASSITSDHEDPAKHLINPETSTVNFFGPAIDDGAVSSCWKNGSSPIIPYGYGAPRIPVGCAPASIDKQNRNNCTRNCQYPGCLKGARGASGLCIAHGGGRRCQKSGCQKGAEGRTIYCKAHGGGRRCEHLGCTKSAEGRTDFCIAHGGGRRCSKDVCTRAARGRSGLCIRHGGGKRCQREDCTKSAEGQSGLCIAHGGGKRCRYPECTKGAQGSTMYCKAHGGGKRCGFPHCGKGAEGSTPFCKGHGGGKRCLFQGGGMCAKSVHGGTQFCVAHGGGKRCAAPECTKSARGRTDCCVRHGGGRRCRSEGCGKSAQGSTDFCKAHGGGRRCSWGEAGSDTGCDRFARGKFGLCAAHLGLMQDHQVHGGETIGILSAEKALPAAAKADKMKAVVVEEEANLVENFIGRASLPEGRVHGGRSLMALLANGAMADHSASQAEGCAASKSNRVSLHAMNYGNLLRESN